MAGNSLDCFLVVISSVLLSTLEMDDLKIDVKHYSFVA